MYRHVYVSIFKHMPFIKMNMYTSMIVQIIVITLPTQTTRFPMESVYVGRTNHSLS